VFPSLPVSDVSDRFDVSDNDQGHWMQTGDVAFRNSLDCIQVHPRVHRDCAMRSESYSYSASRYSYSISPPELAATQRIRRWRAKSWMARLFLCPIDNPGEPLDDAALFNE